MMARANGAYASEPVPNFKAMGIKPRIVANEVIRMGRKRTRQAVPTASRKALALGAQRAREFHDQNAVGNHDANHHDHAHERHDVEGRSGEQQHHNHTGNAGRNGQQDDEGIDERLELRHQDQIDERNGKNQSKSKTSEGLIHALYRPAKIYVHAFGKLGVFQNLLNAAGHAAEIFRGRRYVQIEDAAELVVIHLGGRFDGSEFDDGVQWTWGFSDLRHEGVFASGHRVI